MKISEINANFFHHQLDINEEHNYGASVAFLSF